MHEISLVTTILRALDESVPAEERDVLATVRLKVGRLSGVEPVLLEMAWGVVIADTPWAQVALDIQPVEVRVHCARCDDDFTPVHQRFACPSCGTPSADVRAGQELLIHQLVYGEPVMARGSFDSAAVGRFAQEDGVDSAAVGRFAQEDGVDSAAVGRFAQDDGVDSAS
jgi:hydrogenase nickel incorporation protein HypA/HybF